MKIIILPMRILLKSSIGILMILLILAVTSCDERNAQNSSDLNHVDIDSSKSTILNISGKLFSIPSPIQTASLINRDKAPYRVDMLSDNQLAENIPSRNMKALNLGLIGIDMVYCSFYEDAQNALNYYKSVDKIATDLEIKSAIDQNLINRVGSNVDNPDSLMYLSSEFYESLDAYLKENDRTEIAALVLTGSWIESTMLTALSDDEKAREALAAQKKASSTLNKLMKEVDLSDETFLAQLDSLNISFLAIDKKYQYKTPEVLPEKKKTIIKSETSFQLSDSLHKDIQERLIILHKIING